MSRGCEEGDKKSQPAPVGTKTPRLAQAGLAGVLQAGGLVFWRSRGGGRLSAGNRCFPGDPPAPHGRGGGSVVLGLGHLPRAPPLRGHLRVWEMRSPARVGAELGGGGSRGISPRTRRPPGGPPRARLGSAGPAGDLQAPAPLFGSGGGHPQAALTLGGVLILVYFSPLPKFP